MSVLRSTVPRLRGGYLAEVSSGCDLPIDSLVGSEVTASSRLGQPVVYNILLSFSVEVGFSLFQHIHPPPPNHNYIPNIIRLQPQFFPGSFYLGTLAVLSLAVYLEWLVLIVGLFGRSNSTHQNSTSSAISVSILFHCYHHCLSTASRVSFYM